MARDSVCKDCGQVIYWKETSGGKWKPVDDRDSDVFHECAVREARYEKRRELDEMYATIISDLPVETPMGIYFETCRRCGSHLTTKGNYFPLEPASAIDEDVNGFTGGYLPCQRGRAACSCSIGIYIHETRGVPFFDDLYPGMEGMYKHDLMLLYFQRITGINYSEENNESKEQG